MHKYKIIYYSTNHNMKYEYFLPHVDIRFWSIKGHEMNLVTQRNQSNQKCNVVKKAVFLSSFGVSTTQKNRAKVAFILICIRRS